MHDVQKNSDCKKDTFSDFLIDFMYDQNNTRLHYVSVLSSDVIKRPPSSVKKYPGKFSLQ